MKRQLTILLIVFVAISAFRTQQEPKGKKLYEANCLRCHGAAGNRGFSGSGKLVRSNLGDSATAAVTKNGKRIMPPFKNSLTEAEIKIVDCLH